MTPTAPVDATHADSLAVVEQIRHRLTAVRLQVARWEPRPCPPDWAPERNR